MNNRYYWMAGIGRHCGFKSLLDYLPSPTLISCYEKCYKLSLVLCLSIESPPVIVEGGMGWILAILRVISFPAQLCLPFLWLFRLWNKASFHNKRGRKGKSVWFCGTSKCRHCRSKLRTICMCERVQPSSPDFLLIQLATYFLLSFVCGIYFLH